MYNAPMPILQTGSAATESYLRSEPPEVRRLSESLWNQYSGAPGLLDASPSYGGEVAADQKTGYIYDAQGRYYFRADNHMKVTDKQLRKYVENVSNAAALEMKKSTQQLIAGVILASVWYARMRDLMAALYRTIFVLTIGGWLFEDDATRNFFYVLALLQFSRLDNFYYQIEHEIQPLNGQAMARAGLYGRYGNGFYQNVLLDRAIAEGKTEAKNILGEVEQHCNDSDDRPGCIEVTKMGWISISDMPEIGSRTCYTNCRCRLVFR